MTNKTNQLPMIVLLFCCLNFFTTGAQEKVAQDPRLIVLITIDQLRYDYLERFASRYTETGFKKIIQKGFVMANTHYSYTPTFTGVGHATIGTGTSPAIHGIAANEWYNRFTKSTMYCVSDNEVETVGSSGTAGKFSPKNLRSSTFAEQLKLSNSSSKTIGIALKDRGAILPVGHKTDGAYWFEGTEGKFITSSFYKNELPLWVKNFNKEEWPNQYLNNQWAPLYPLETYTSSTADNMPFEIAFKGEAKPTFPHDLPRLRKENGLGLIRNTPFGNSLSFEFAKSAILGEEMGQDSIVDFLSLSLSSTDYVGHQFGPHSIEVEDMYLRLDQDLSDFLSYLDKEVGNGDYVLVLTSDHGAADVPAYLSGNAHYFDNEGLHQKLIAFSEANFGSNLVEKVMNEQVYLDHTLLKSKGLEINAVKKGFLEFLSFEEGVVGVSDPSNNLCIADNNLCNAITNGFYAKRSGDIFYIMEPGWIGSYTKAGGTTHGSPFPYDTHVPLIWYGHTIASGKSYSATSIKDIAPTLSFYTGVSLPNGATGTPIAELLNSLKK